MGETEKTLKKNTMTKECIFTALLILMEKKPYEEIIGYINRRMIFLSNILMKSLKNCWNGQKR